MGRHVGGLLDRMRPPASTAVAGALYGLGTVLGLLAVLFVADALLSRDPALVHAVAVAIVPLVYDLLFVPLKPLVVSLDDPTVSQAGLSRSGAADYRRLFRTHLWARLAGLSYSVLFLPVVVAVALVAGTAASSVLYWAAIVETPSPDYYVLAVYGLVYAVWMAGILPPAFADRFALAGERPRWAWLASARVLWAHRRVATRYATVRFGLGVGPLLVALAVAVVVPGEGPVASLAVLAALVGTAIVARTIQLRYHRATHEQVASPRTIDATGLRELRPRISPSGRTVVAALLVTGLLAGSVAIRVTDVRPDAEAVPAAVGTDDPRLYAVARARSVGVSHSGTLEAYTGTWSQDELDPDHRNRWVVDYPDRQVRLDAWTGDERTTWDHANTVYADDGLRVAGRPARAKYVIAAATVDGRAVLATPHYPSLFGGASFEVVPGPGVDWEQSDRRDGAIVLVTTDPDTVAAWTGFDGDDTVHEDTEMRVRIAPDEQRIRRVVVRHRFVRYETRERTEVSTRVASRYEVTLDYEGVDVDRPEGLGFRPGGFVWDLLYY